MATMEPNSNDNNKPMFSEEANSKAIAMLPLHKQLALRSKLAMCDKMSREQAIEMLKQCLIQMENKDRMWLNILMDK